MSLVVAIEPAYVSTETIRAAAALAVRWGVSLVLTSLPPGRRAARPEVEETVKDLAKVLAAEGVDVKRVQIQGDAEEGLLECARTREARLVVFAEDPHSSRIDHLAGAVVRSLPIPLMVVRDPASLEAWARGGEPLAVLAALDFTPASEAALAWARGLCWMGACDLIVGHVGWLPGLRQRLGLTTPLDPQAEEDEIRRVVIRDLKEFVGEVTGAASVSFEVRLGLGRTADALAFLAEEVSARLVVVGTNQRSGLSRLWHGTVAGAVLRECGTNVVCVPEESGQRPAERRIPELASVLVATDFSEQGDRAVPYAYSLLPKGGTVHLVHVAEPSEASLSDDELRRRLRALEPAPARQRGVQTLEELIRSRNAGEALCGLATRRGADVIVVGSHGRSGLSRALFGSVTESVLRHATIPVLVVRPPAEGDD